MEGRTLDVSEAAEVAGLRCPVSVTPAAWKHLVADDHGDFPSEGDAENLAYLMDVLAKAYTVEGRDIYIWIFSTCVQGEMVFKANAEAGR